MMIGRVMSLFMAAELLLTDTLSSHTQLCVYCSVFVASIGPPKVTLDYFNQTKTHRHILPAIKFVRIEADLVRK